MFLKLVIGIQQDTKRKPTVLGDRLIFENSPPYNWYHLKESSFKPTLNRGPTQRITSEPQKHYQPPAPKPTFEPALTATNSRNGETLPTSRACYLQAPHVAHEPFPSPRVFGGAGCGLLGLSLALQGSQVTLSDAQPQASEGIPDL